MSVVISELNRVSKLEPCTNDVFFARPNVPTRSTTTASVLIPANRMILFLRSKIAKRIAVTIAPNTRPMNEPRVPVLKSTNALNTMRMR